MELELELLLETNDITKSLNTALSTCDLYQFTVVEPV